RAAVSSTVTGRAAPGEKSRTPAMNRNETGAMTVSRRRSAGRAGSAAGIGSPAITSVCPPTSKTYSSGNVGGFSARPMSDGPSTANIPAVPPVRSQYGIRGERGEPAADREQRGNASGCVLHVEPRDRLVDRPRDLGAARHTVPRRVHAVEEIVRRRIAGEQHERLDPRALVHRRATGAEALRLVHAPAAGGDR